MLIESEKYLACNFFKDIFSKLRSLRWALAGQIFILVAVIAFSGWIMFHTFGYKDGTFLIKSRVWSDFGGHIQMIRSFSMGENFPPQYPTYSGPPMRYHFLFYFLVAMMEKAGINIALAFNLLSAIGFALFLGLIYYLARLFFNSTAVGILALLLFLFNGTLDWVVFFQKHPLNLNSWREIISSREFVSFGPWNGIISAFWTLNIYTNQRHLAMGYAWIILFLLPIYYYTLKGRETKKPYLLALLMMGTIMPILHVSIIPVTIVYSFLWMAFYPRTIRQFGWFYLALIVVAIPGFLYLRGDGASRAVIELGFLAHAKTWKSWATYWWMNMGLYCFIWPVLLWWAKKPVKLWLISGLILFVGANTVRFSTEMFNNHKLLNFFIMGVQLTTAGWLVWLWRRAFFLKIIAVILFVGVTFSGVIDIFPIINDPTLIMKDRPRLDTIDWIAQNTPPKSVFLSSSGFYNPASLAGRKIYCGYSYFPWSMGYPVYQREKTVFKFFSPRVKKGPLCQVLRDEGIDYVIISPGPGDWAPRVDAQKSRFVKRWQPLFISQEGVKIYSVADNCRDTPDGVADDDLADFGFGIPILPPGGTWGPPMSYPPLEYCPAGN